MISSIRLEGESLQRYLAGMEKRMRAAGVQLGAAGEHLWVDTETALRARQQLLPVAEARAAELATSRRSVAALQVRLLSILYQGRLVYVV